MNSANFYCICLAFFTLFSQQSLLALPVTRGDFRSKVDSLPRVFAVSDADILQNRLRNEALLISKTYQLPENKDELANYRKELRKEIIDKTGIKFYKDLPFNVKETGSTKMEGYTIKNIAFQTRPGVYATANLYIPDGIGPFPGVITMMGHSANGRLYDPYQSVGHSLALNGYVSLHIDPWGAGERSTVQGKFEYHGAYLGASLMNVGETLMGMQVTDNMRGVDFLRSLDYVDPQNIGATGASGGGNQTMWLTAIDERIKAAVPVVSVGTFESAVMRSNCVCELLVDGLTFTETWGVLSLIAPRSLKICNHKKDSNPTFYPSEMLRSYNRVKSIYKMEGVENKLTYELVDDVHGYKPEDRKAMLGWFDLHLKGKGRGTPKEEIPFAVLPAEKLMTYPTKERDKGVEGTADFCRRIGNELRHDFLSSKTFDIASKKKKLEDVLRLDEPSTLQEVHRYSRVDGWDRFALETTDGKLIPVLLQSPKKSGVSDYVIVCNPEGKAAIAPELIADYTQKGKGIVIVDLSGTGEAISSASVSYDKTGKLHTLSRAELWLGETVLGEWTKELGVVAQFLKIKMNAKEVDIDGTKEAGAAALFFGALNNTVTHLVLRNTPVSYLFDDRESVDYFSMAIHLPRFLNWGDISLAAALSAKDIKFIDPVSMSGREINQDQLKEVKQEFDTLRLAYKQSGNTIFEQGN